MPKIRIGDVAKIIDGAHATPKKTKSGKVYLGIRAVSEDGKLIPENFDFLSDIDFVKWSKRASLQKDDIIFSYEATLNRYAIIPDNLHGCLGRRLAIVRLKDKNSINPKWLYYYFRTRSWQAFIENNIFTGSTVNRISIDEFPTHIVSAPDIAIQSKIISILSTLDYKIELNKKINAELEATARFLYDYWFVQFDFPDGSGRPYKSSGGQMVYNKVLKREIPVGWQIVVLKDFLEFEKGIETGSRAYSSEPKDDNSIKYYRVGDIDGNCQTFVSSSEYDLKIVQPTNVVITFDGSVGKLGFGLDGAISGGLRHIYDKSGKISNAAIWAIFSDQQIIANIRKFATGSVLKHASSAIDYLKIPYEEQVLLRFQSIIEPIFMQIITSKQESAWLIKLRDYLLPLLMNGQVVIVD